MTSTSMYSDERPKLLEVRNLHTNFFTDEGIVRAVNGVNFEISYGQTVGVVGESGCGKSIAAASILRIVPRPGRIVDGEILLHHHKDIADPLASTTISDLVTLNPNGSEIRKIRGAEISMIFQEPMTALSPIHTIGDQVGEVIILHQKLDKTAARVQVIEMLERVGMPQPRRTIDRYPFELSGGMRQRAVIAMALSCHPSLLIADEPTTALDVTTEAQILQLLRNLQRELGMAILFITHNLGVVAQMTEQVIVMYLGREVEVANVDSIFYNAKHPYTCALLRSIPRLGKKSGKLLQTISGSVPDPYNIPKGCPFHPRCKEKIQNICEIQDPPLVNIAPGHQVRCHLYSRP